MAMLGGAGHIGGAVVGAALVTLLQNALQDVLPRCRAITAAAGSDRVRPSLSCWCCNSRAAASCRSCCVSCRGRRGRLLPPPSPLPRRAMPQAGIPLLTVRRICSSASAALMAVNEVGFEVAAGEILGLIGPNGAGKSTLFNLITGAAQASDGQHRLPRRATSSARRRDASPARGIARTFQHVKLRPNMTLIDNVMLGAYLRTRSRASSPARCGSTAPRNAPPAPRRCAQLQRVGLSDQALRPRRQSAARAAAPSGSRARARGRSDLARCSTSRPPDCAARRSRRWPNLLRALRDGGRDHPARSSTTWNSSWGWSIASW